MKISCGGFLRLAATPLSHLLLPLHYGDRKKENIRFFKVLNFYSLTARFNTKDLKIANLIGIFVDKFFKEDAKLLANLVGRPNWL